MSTAVQALTVALPVAYLAAALVHGLSFAGERAPRVAAMHAPLLRLVLAAHAALFVLHGVEAGGFPPMGPWLVVSSVAWCVALLFALVTVRTPQPTVGAVVLAVASAMQLVASAFGPVAVRAGLPPAPPETAVHVVLAVAASATIVLSGLYGAVYLVLFRQLRRHTFGPLARELPDLPQLVRATRRTALVGFLLLALGLNAGIAIAHAKGTAGFEYTDPHVLLTLLIWLHFGLIAFSRKLPGLTARRSAWAAAIGLGVLLVALFVTLVPGLTFHRMR